MRRLAVLTTPNIGLYADEVLLHDALSARGVEPVLVDWQLTSPAALSAFDGVLMRTPWNWYRHRSEFRAFLNGLASVSCPVINPADLMRRFSDKTYFRALDALGVATVPTAFFESAADVARMPEVLAGKPWRRCVLKPSFTANAFGALPFDARDASLAIAHANATPIDGAWMLQPFVDGITAEGEWSFIFFDGVFSHAMRKQPKAGDFRVQHEHGGAAHPVTPDSSLLAQATHIAQRAVPDAAFARIDGVRFEGAFVVMEIEVVEPELFFRSEPNAAARFADAITRRL